MTRLVAEHGAKRWSLIATSIRGRTGKQCRERWLNHLDPAVNKGVWSAEEDRVLVEAQARLGNRWSQIARMLQGRCAASGRSRSSAPQAAVSDYYYLLMAVAAPPRSENAVKNRWNSLMNRRYPADAALLGVPGMFAEAAALTHAAAFGHPGTFAQARPPPLSDDSPGTASSLRDGPCRPEASRSRSAHVAHPQPRCGAHHLPPVVSHSLDPVRWAGPASSPAPAAQRRPQAWWVATTQPAPPPRYPGRPPPPNAKTRPRRLSSWS